VKLLVYGSRDYAHLVRDHLELCSHEFCGFIDDEQTGAGIVGPYEEALRSHSRALHGIAIGIGYKDLPGRRTALERLQRDGWQLPVLIHPRAWVRDHSAIGAGTVVMAGASVELNAAIGIGCVLWSNVVVSHDSRVGDNTFLSPGVTVCGFARIGRDCFVGAGAVIVDHGNVPDGSFVRAGQVLS
jgi:sugar O-acyltransferase (sialic acid O-acetyltransferase NeuD family)